MAKRINWVVQPDYRAWESVQIGMSRDQVTAILGEPPRDRFLTALPYVTYGWIQFRASPHPRAYTFTLGYDKSWNVWHKSDPFNGDLSPDGKPSKPRIIIPQQNAEFGHYPRVLDVRWRPSSGVYPIRYAIETAISSPGFYDFQDHRRPNTVDQPYVVLMLPGSQPGRVRVRGENAIGVGEWSDYRYFDFSIAELIE